MENSSEAELLDQINEQLEQNEKTNTIYDWSVLITKILLIVAVNIILVIV